MLDSPLRRERKNKGVSQVEISKILGVSQGYVSQVDQGLVKPTGKMADLLDVLGILEEQKAFTIQRLSYARAKLEMA